MYVCNFVDSAKGYKIFLQVFLLRAPLQFLPCFPSSLSDLLSTLISLPTSRSLARTNLFSDFRFPLSLHFFPFTLLFLLYFFATFSDSFTFPFSLLCSALLSSLSSSSPPIFPLKCLVASTSLRPNTISFHSLSTSHISPLPSSPSLFPSLLPSLSTTAFFAAST